MKTLDEMKYIVAQCHYDALDEKWDLVIRLDVERPYLQIICDGKCNIKGTPLKWSSRKWFLSYHMTTTELVRTVHKAVIAAVTHEANERFTYRGARVFDPHIDIEELAKISERLDVRT